MSARSVLRTASGAFAARSSVLARTCRGPDRELRWHDPAAGRDLEDHEEALAAREAAEAQALAAEARGRGGGGRPPRRGGASRWKRGPPAVPPRRKLRSCGPSSAGCGASRGRSGHRPFEPAESLRSRGTAATRQWCARCIRSRGIELNAKLVEEGPALFAGLPAKALTEAALACTGGADCPAPHPQHGAIAPVRGRTTGAAGHRTVALDRHAPPRPWRVVPAAPHRCSERP